MAESSEGVIRPVDFGGPKKARSRHPTARASEPVPNKDEVKLSSTPTSQGPYDWKKEEAEASSQDEARLSELGSAATDLGNLEE